MYYWSTWLGEETLVVGVSTGISEVVISHSSQDLMKYSWVVFVNAYFWHKKSCRGSQYVRCRTATNPFINTRAHDHQHMTIYPKEQKLTNESLFHSLDNSLLFSICASEEPLTLTLFKHMFIQDNQAKTGRFQVQQKMQTCLFRVARRYLGPVTLHILYLVTIVQFTNSRFRIQDSQSKDSIPAAPGSVCLNRTVGSNLINIRSQCPFQGLESLSKLINNLFTEQKKIV